MPPAAFHSSLLFGTGVTPGGAPSCLSAFGSGTEIVERHLTGPQFPHLSSRDVLRTLVSHWEASSVLSLRFAQLRSWANLEAKIKINT